jgi:uncharacterized protein YabE (DUF348 family)
MCPDFMKLITRKKLPFTSIALAAALLLGISVWWVAAQTPAQAEEGTGHLITIYDRGEEVVLLSDGETIADALKQAAITVDSHDVVEPAVNEKMVASEYHVNIYRSRPVTVVDGALRERIMTAHQTPEQIITDAGISVYPEDTSKLSRSTDLIGDGAGLQLTIDRAIPFSFELYGSTTTARSQAATVGEMLQLKGITLGESDRITPDIATPITEGMNVRLWREGKQTITAEEPVAFASEQIRDADRPTTYKEVQTPGKNGSRNVTYEVEIINGQEVGRVEIASIVLTEPVKQIEVIGTKPLTLEYTGGGTKTEWLAASNIPEESWGYADSIVSRESGWNPNATNRSSGACGLAQALPCSKVPGNPLNPTDSLNWMNGYVNGRYGGWQQAYNFWQANHWY